MTKFNSNIYRECIGMMTPEELQRIKDKANWEHISLSAVCFEYPDLVPKKLRRKMKSSIIKTEERRHEV